MWHLLAAPPQWLCFSSTTAAGGCIVIPRNPHHDACAVAGIDALTVHGLRRSFMSLTEWLDIPAGVVAQIVGHKPSATAEKHYTVRPLDLLHLHHERIEAWILEQAAVQFDAQAEPELLTLPADMQARFLHIAEMLQDFGPQRVGLPHIRPLESKLWEMRMQGRDGIARAVYAAVQGRRLLVLHVFVKKTQTTPRKAIETALNRIEAQQ